MMNDLLKWVLARGREPSTYAGLAALLGYFGVPDSISFAKDITTAGVGLCGLLAMIMMELGD